MMRNGLDKSISYFFDSIFLLILFIFLIPSKDVFPTVKIYFGFSPIFFNLFVALKFEVK